MCTFSGCLVGQILKFWQPTLALLPRLSTVAPPQTGAAGKLINRGTRSVDSHSVGVWTWMAEDVEPDDKKPPWTRLDGVHEKCTINNSLMIFIICWWWGWCTNNQSSAAVTRVFLSVSQTISQIGGTSPILRNCSPLNNLWPFSRCLTIRLWCWMVLLLAITSHRPSACPSNNWPTTIEEEISIKLSLSVLRIFSWSNTIRSSKDDFRSDF